MYFAATDLLTDSYAVAAFLLRSFLDTNNLLFCRFPLIMSFRYSYADLRQHLTLLIAANFQNGDQQKTSNTDDESV